MMENYENWSTQNLIDLYISTVEHQNKLYHESWDARDAETIEECERLLYQDQDIIDAVVGVLRQRGNDPTRLF